MNKVLFRPGMSIKEIGEQLQGYIAANWKQTLDDHREALLKVFPELEDATYGVYLDHLRLLYLKVSNSPALQRFKMREKAIFLSERA